MSIVTKTGDKGQTSLWSGERVDKDDIRIEAYGTLDELTSHLGEVKHYVSNEYTTVLEGVQRDLIRIMGELACKNKRSHDPIRADEIEALTTLIHKMEKEIKFTGFLIPGKSINSARIDICRTVCRRAERRIITLSKHEEVSEFILQYVNRLSDLLFLVE